MELQGRCRRTGCLKTQAVNRGDRLTLTQVPPLADAITVAKQLNTQLRRKGLESLSAVLDAAACTSLKEFAAGLRRDIGAIQAALDPPWTTSPVEGQVNRLKMLKRTINGRAGFKLLRAGVFHAA